MKKIIIALVVTSSLFACKSNKKDKSVKLEIAVTSDYCGGAAPPDEMIEEMRIPKPYTGVLYIHKSRHREDDGIELTFDKGAATAKGLVPGQYYAYLEKKMDLKNESAMNEIASQGIDVGCLIELNFMIMFVFNIEESTKIITEKMHKICNPCLPPAP